MQYKDSLLQTCHISEHRFPFNLGCTLLDEKGEGLKAEGDVGPSQFVKHMLLGGLVHMSFV